MRQFTWIFLVWIVLLSVAQAASFDCAKASLKAEKQICENYELSKLDESLHKAYQRSLERNDVKQQAIKSQRQWLKDVRNPCQTTDCIKSAYETRIKEVELMSSFGIVIMSAPGNTGASPTDQSNLTKTTLPDVPTAPPKQETDEPQLALVTTPCDKSPLSEEEEVTKEKAVLRLVEIARAKLELQQYECVVQALEQSNRKVKSIDDGAERAAMGLEIKDAVWNMIQQKKFPDVLFEKRIISAAVQSIESNGELSKSSSEDERFNDAAFYGRLADAKCVDKGYLIKGTNCEYREYIIKMYQMDFSLPSTRHFVEAWRYAQYLQELSLLEIANLWKVAPEDNRLPIEAALASRLGQPIQSYVLIGIELMSPEKAQKESEGLSILQPAIERVKAKQSDFWIWWVYRYSAEAYWQAGNKEEARVLLGKARNSIKTAKSAPAGRVNSYMNLATSLCKLIRDNGKAIQMCPIGIYDAKELAALFDELEEMAKVTSDTYALGRVEVLRKRLPPAATK